MNNMEPTICIVRNLVLTALTAFGGYTVQAGTTNLPNIVYILCDDLGYGDVHALNPQRGKIPTPQMDRLAKEGIIFTDTHAGSSVCTPSRYGILTGRYSWRTHLQRGVLGGFGKPLIAPDRLTVAELLRRHGYETACIGKWHLGLDWPGRGTNVDYAKPIDRGPVTLGFDYFFGISGSLDMFPFIWIQNDHTVGAATATKTFVHEGPAEPGFEAIDVLPTLTKKSCDYIHEQAVKKSGKPFFLYLPVNSPHAPIIPTKEWLGKSGLGDYGDFVMETDWSVGEVLKALADTGLADNTIVIFTSDNGCSPVAKPEELEVKGHFPSAQFRGYKADIWDGGHRIPFIVRWPGKVKPGSQSDSLLCLTDFMATLADLVNEKLPDNAGEDSFSFLSELTGTGKTARTSAVHHSINGRFAIRDANWKLEFCPGSGGWGKPHDLQAEKKGLPNLQLYDMTADVGEVKNLQGEQTDIVARLTAELEKIVAEGRSTPGSPQKNDVRVDIWKEKTQPLIQQGD
jgi:arylsulfatase A